MGAAEMPYIFSRELKDPRLNRSVAKFNVIVTPFIVSFGKNEDVTHAGRLLERWGGIEKEYGVRFNDVNSHVTGAHKFFAMHRTDENMKPGLRFYVRKTNEKTLYRFVLVSGIPNPEIAYDPTLEWFIHIYSDLYC